MKRRWKILIALGVLLVLLAASLSVTMHVQPANELEAYKKLLRAKGEKLELSEVIPPPVAPESNSVDAVQDAFRMFGSGNENIPYAMEMVAPGKALIGWKQPDARGYDFTNSWDDFGAKVAADGAAIDLLHQVLERPKLDFQLDYKQGNAVLMTHLTPLKHSAQKLEAAAVYELHNGDNGAAVTNILTMLALVRNDAAEGLLISHLVRIAMTTIAITPTWELLLATNVTDAQLAALQKNWERMDFLNDLENSIVVERAWMGSGIQKMRASHEGFAGTLGRFGSSSGSTWSWPPDWNDITEHSRDAIGEVMWRSSWSYSDELYLLKSGQLILEALRTIQTNRSQFYKADYDAIKLHLSSLGYTTAGEAFFRALDITYLNEFRDGSYGNALGVTLRIEAVRDVVITAIALKRFQLNHGKWPETLGKLVPEFLVSVPIDPYDGKPLKYHPNTDGTFLLYSVGENGVDDGGNAAPLGSSASSLREWHWDWRRGYDWVWPQPATPAEVQNYFMNTSQNDLPPPIPVISGPKSPP
jgi:hypothetical protein